MKKIALLAAMCCAFFACKDKAKELTLEDVVGAYRGSAVGYVYTNDIAVDTFGYIQEWTNPFLFLAEVSREVQPYYATELYGDVLGVIWYPIYMNSIGLTTNFQGEVNHVRRNEAAEFYGVNHKAYTLPTRLGSLSVDAVNSTYEDLPAVVEFKGKNIHIYYADTVRGWTDTTGKRHDVVIVRHEYSGARVE